jgi:hypothetical protein
MVFAPHSRVSFGGRLISTGEPDEIWSCNVNVIHTGTDAAYMAAILTPLRGWFGSDSQCSQSSSIDYVKVNAIGPNGGYADPTSTTQHIYDGGRGPVAPAAPSIMSLATSWSTALGRGPGAHGRIYLPNFVQAAAGTMQVPNSFALAVQAAGKALLTALSNGGGTPVVASAVGSGSNTTITGVRVGDIYDTQRRRKNAYNEVYVSTPFP